jgi:hypothetical protein
MATAVVATRVTTSARRGPGPGCGDTCATCGNGRGGSLADTCVGQGGGNGGFFSRYCGQDCGCVDGCAPGCGDACGCNGGCCGDGYPAGQYDCSACGSPYWGNCGYRHPHGYVTGRECMCGGPGQCRPPGPIVAPCGNGYCCSCCGQPAPGCCCNSGDQHYNFNPGPPVAQTAYPYYTPAVRADFDRQSAVDWAVLTARVQRPGKSGRGRPGSLQSVT